MLYETLWNYIYNSFKHNQIVWLYTSLAHSNHPQYIHRPASGPMPSPRLSKLSPYFRSNSARLFNTSHTFCNKPGFDGWWVMNHGESWWVMVSHGESWWVMVQMEENRGTQDHKSCHFPAQYAASVVARVWFCLKKTVGQIHWDDLQTGFFPTNMCTWLKQAANHKWCGSLEPSTRPRFYHVG